MTLDEIIEVRDAAAERGDQATYLLAWVALGYHRHPAFTLATDSEREKALQTLQVRCK